VTAAANGDHLCRSCMQPESGLQTTTNERRCCKGQRGSCKQAAHDAASGRRLWRLMWGAVAQLVRSYGNRSGDVLQELPRQRRSHLMAGLRAAQGV
jgi:hypothetical protein